MSPVHAAALWIGIHALFLAYISARVGRVRLKNKINIGDDGNEDLRNAIRTQGNYIEYAPAALLGLWALASLNASTAVIHGFGIVFLCARIAHLMGLGMSIWAKGRLVGTALTMLTLIGMGGSLIVIAITGS